MKKELLTSALAVLLSSSPLLAQTVPGNNGSTLSQVVGELLEEKISLSPIEMLQPDIGQSDGGKTKGDHYCQVLQHVNLEPGATVTCRDNRDEEHYSGRVEHYLVGDGATRVRIVWLSTPSHQDNTMTELGAVSEGITGPTPVIVLPEGSRLTLR